MNIVNLKDWFSTDQTLLLCGLKYNTQLLRLRKSRNLVYQKLCPQTFYLRDSVMAYLLSRPEMHTYKIVLDNKYSVRYNYKKLLELMRTVSRLETYHISLAEWQPYCMLDPKPEPMVLSRLTDQLILPQIRYHDVFGMKFYNVADIRRELYESK